jgi:hypothetical protein
MGTLRVGVAGMLILMPAPVLAGAGGLSSLVQDIGLCLVLAGAPVL